MIFIIVIQFLIILFLINTVNCVELKAQAY